MTSTQQEKTTDRKVKSFPMYMDRNGCDYHRIRVPFQYGVGLFNEEYDRPFSPADLLYFLNQAEVIVFNRAFQLGFDRLKQLKDDGKKIVVDMDDWIELPDYHPNYREYKDWAAAEIFKCLDVADLITCTTDRLRNKIAEYYPKQIIHVVPNAMPVGRGQFVERKDIHEEFRFVYAGQSSHLEDVRLMQSSMVRIKSIKDIRFKLAGWKDHPIWHKMEAVYSKMQGYERQLSVSLNEYMTVYDDADCSIAPLCTNFFNSCKSNLKVLEAACKKIPIIVSNVSPYRDDADAPVIWVNRPEDWYRQMKKISENRSMASEMGIMLYEWANEKYNFDKINRMRFQIYQSLV